MIDLRLVREQPDLVRASQRARGADESLVDKLLAADADRREAVARADKLRGEQKTASQAVRSASAEERPAVLERAKALSAEVKEAEEAERAADAALRAAHLPIPNVVADEVPPGGEDDAVTLRTVGEVPAYDFAVRDHLEIGEALGAIDMERGAKVSGARFYFLTGPGALLEFALAQLAISRAVAAGFTPSIAPALVGREAMEGTGFLGEHDEEVYRIERDDLYLVGTSEVAIAGMRADEVLDLSGGPRALRRLVVLLPPRGRLLRQGHPRHHPRALVRQGGDVQLLPARGADGRAPAAARSGRRSSSPRSSSPTGWSTSPPATSAPAPPASTTSRRGSPARAPTAS